MNHKIKWLTLAIFTSGFVIALVHDSESKSQTKGEYTEFNIIENRGEVENSYTAFDLGYYWAEKNNASSFNDCQNEFGTSEAENGCNEYIKENYTGYSSFNGYECTEDCAGHQAGFEWAENNGIENVNDCGGYSNSFIEGCISFVEENY